MKKCTNCKEEKPLVQFNKQQSNKDGLQVYCRKCDNAKGIAWQKANPERTKLASRRYYLANKDKVNETAKRNRLKNPDISLKTNLKKFNLTLDEFRELLKKQNNCCAICRELQFKFSKRRLQVDHNHNCCSLERGSCGKCIRGLLCQGCNTGLGSFRDDSVRLTKAIDYLKATDGIMQRVAIAPSEIIL